LVLVGPPLCRKWLQYLPNLCTAAKIIECHEPTLPHRRNRHPAMG
jgi:hypothetical protein